MCLFCKLVNKEIPAKILFEDDEILAFHDINPTAPTHLLVIPKKHVASISDAAEEDRALLGSLLLGAKRAAAETGIDETGYRVVVNNGPHANQTVFHIHVHVIGGRQMGWPPG